MNVGKLVEDVIGQNLAPMVTDAISQSKPEYLGLAQVAADQAKILQKRLGVFMQDSRGAADAIQLEIDPVERARLQASLESSLVRSKQYLIAGGIAFGEGSLRRTWETTVEVVMRVVIATVKALV